MAGSPVPLLQSDRPPLQSLPHHPVATGQYFLLTRAEIETLGGGRDYDPGNIPHWETPWDDPLSVIATLLHISSSVMFSDRATESVSKPASSHRNSTGGSHQSGAGLGTSTQLSVKA